MAAGAIPPPLFFEQRHHASICLQRMASSETPENTLSSIARLAGRRAQARQP
jgi:hypothetical protein